MDLKATILISKKLIIMVALRSYGDVGNFDCIIVKPVQTFVIQG